MRRRLLVAAVAAALWATATHAAQIVQNVSGTQRSGTPLTLFDPTLGSLDSVQIEGTVGLAFDLIRFNSLDTAVTIGHSSSACLSLGVGPSFGCTSTSGNEHYDAGSMFGLMSLSGDVFTILIGGDVTQFIASGAVTSSLIIPVENPVPPQVGQTLFGPGNVFPYSLKVTYTYSLIPIPEPATWLLMMVGFGAIGWALRRRRIALPVT